MTKPKSILLIQCFCSIAIGMIVCSGTIGIRIGNQLAHASLLGGDTVSQPSDFGKQLLNETGDGQTNDQESSTGEQTNQQQLQPEELQSDNSAAEQVSKPSESVKQSIADAALINRLFPYILDHLDSTTLIKRIDPAELFNKLIIPHLRVSLTGDRQVNGGFGEKDGKGLTILSVQTPSCFDPNADPQDRKLATAGGAQIDVNTRYAHAIIVNGVPDDRLVGSRPGDLPNTWRAQAIIEGHDRLTTYVDCRGIQVAYVP